MDQEGVQNITHKEKLKELRLLLLEKKEGVTLTTYEEVLCQFYTLKKHSSDTSDFLNYIDEKF